MTIALDQEEAAGRKPPGLGSGIAAVLAATAATFFYWVAQSSLPGLGQSGDPAGRGLTAAIAVFAEMLLWLCLGLYLVAQCWRSRLAGVLLAGVGLAWFAAAWAATVAIMVMDGAGERADWLSLFPTTLPLVAVLFGLWVRAGRHLQRRTHITGMVLFAVVTAPLIVLPVREKQRWDAAAPLRALVLAAVNAAFEWDLQQRIRAADAAEGEADQPPLPPDPTY